MPWVTVPGRPSGEPTAITDSPTWLLSESPICNGLSDAEALTLITAMSYDGLRPTRVAFTLRPPGKTTRIVDPSAAPATTWLLVMIRPCLSITNPDPVPRPTWIITVPGRT